MKSEKDAFLEMVSVSRETIHRLERYEALLTSWNEKINLVSKNTIPHIWSRHFLDSAQLMRHLPEEASTLADMGAGAGFPGLVLAILSKERPAPLKVYAIESIKKKASFLQAVVDDLELDVHVVNERIETIKDFRADIVTARALKPLPELLKYANRVAGRDSALLFLKGQNLSEELTHAKKYWTFSHRLYKSLSEDSGRILAIKNLQYKQKRRT
ncbi:MAG: 16S rRNA (guanine(527)-N(7))-methyltransferase RsmG [Alphaproteobacteria bacterium]|nr:16S rRNA (guanine(527)-N(7))-methyltransferase RsmG [Alphaproteobacteria bacterium]